MQRLAQPAMGTVTLHELQRRQILSCGNEYDRRHREASRDELIAEVESGACTKLNIYHKASWGAERLIEILFSRCESFGANLDDAQQSRERATHGLVVVDNTHPVRGVIRKRLHLMRRTRRWSSRKKGTEPMLKLGPPLTRHIGPWPSAAAHLLEGCETSH